MNQRVAEISVCFVSGAPTVKKRGRVTTGVSVGKFVRDVAAAIQLPDLRLQTHSVAIDGVPFFDHEEVPKTIRAVIIKIG